ncbi:MAG: non-heme iron oxygenase ferredoxin subunit [Herpetosiphonaceae bacterium]|nr:non-heme iron oxygenase ferredoxin subunit [Herpetosiphonaceae bacterium]
MTFVSVASVHNVPAGSAVQVVVNGQQIGLFNCAGTIYATDNICTHAYAELHEGTIDADDCSIECPLHGARFDLATGRALSLPAIMPVQIYAVRIEGDDIQVAL